MADQDNPALISISSGVASDQKDEAARKAAGEGTGGTGSQPSVGAEFKTMDPGLAGKNFRTQADLEKAYLESQKEMSQGINELTQHREWQSQFEPHRAAFEAFLESQAKTAEAEAQNKNRTGGKDGLTAEAVQAMLEKALLPIQQGMQSGNAEAAKVATTQGRERFQKETSDYDQYKDDMATLVKSGRVGVVGDPKDPNTYYEAAKTAYGLAKHQRTAKDAAAKNAASVEGGSGEAGSGEFSGKGMPLSDLREKIVAEG